MTRTGDLRVSVSPCPCVSASPRPRVREWLWLALFTTVTVLLIELPYLLAYGQAANGLIFGGMIWAAHDFPQYASAMREAAGGPSWLVHDHLTGESHSPALMYTLYVALGKIAALLKADIQLVYHLAEIASRAVLLVSFYLFTGGVLGSIQERRLALGLAVYASGLGILIGLPLHVLGVRHVLSAPELYLPELSTFLVFFTAPHLMLGLALLLFAGRVYLAAWSSSGPWYPLLAGLAVLGLGLVNPFSLLTICSVVLVHAGIMRLRPGRVPRSAVLAIGCILLAAAPMIVYLVARFQLDPFWGVVYGKQNHNFSPAPLDLLAGLGVSLPLAIFGLKILFRRAPVAAWLISIWIVSSVVLMYLAPATAQRRFGFGLAPILAATAAVGLPRLWQWIRARHGLPMALDRTLMTFGLALSLFLSSVSLYAFLLVSVSNAASSTAREHLFQPRSVVEAGAWLASQMEADEVVLGQTRTGNHLAGVIRGRVFVGHWTATLDYAEKEQLTERFYRADLDPAAARSMLVHNNIRYVVYGPHERELGASHPAPELGLRQVYASSEVTIYGPLQVQSSKFKVQRPGTPSSFEP